MTAKKPHVRTHGRESKRTSPGAAGLAARTREFEQYILQGHNQTEAATMCGYSARTAHVAGYRMMARLRESGRLALAAQKAGAAVELETKRTLQEVQRVAYNDSRRFFHPNGRLKLPELWDEDMGACVASIEMGETVMGFGKDVRVEPFVKKLRFWSKPDMIEKAMRHAGLFERDNRQKGENLAIQINLVGGPQPQHTNGNGGVTIETTLVGGRNGSHP